MKKEKIIEKVAGELIEGVNKQKTMKKKNRIKDIDTLCNFGVLGILTPRQITEAFYNGFNKK